MAHSKGILLRYVIFDQIYFSSLISAYQTSCIQSKHIDCDLVGISSMTFAKPATQQCLKTAVVILKNIYVYIYTNTRYAKSLNLCKETVFG